MMRLFDIACYISTILAARLVSLQLTHEPSIKNNWTPAYFGMTASAQRTFIPFNLESLS